jgi:hypothetical protein
MGKVVRIAPKAPGPEAVPSTSQSVSAPDSKPLSTLREVVAKVQAIAKGRGQQAPTAKKATDQDPKKTQVFEKRGRGRGRGIPGKFQTLETGKPGTSKASGSKVVPPSRVTRSSVPKAPISQAQFEDASGIAPPK